MPIRVTMRENRRSEDGLSTLLTGQTYTVGDDFGRVLILTRGNIDTDGALTSGAAANRDELLASEVRTVRTLVSGAWTVPTRNVGYEGEQPANITKPVLAMGRVAARFGSGMWTATSGAPTLTQGYTGWDGSGARTGITSRTGQPDMLRAVPAANTTEQITLGTFATNMLTKSLAGKLGLWVYVEAQPGYGVAGAVTGSIFMEFSTSGATSNGMSVYWNSNQVREGWNFLQFVMRDPQAYVQASGVVEYHPFGTSAAMYGNGSTTNIVANDIGVLRLGWVNMLGATLYFDSMWTGYSSKAQLVLGCDSGANLEEIAVPIFQQYGWVGYTAIPYGVQDTGASTLTYQPVLTGTAVDARRERIYALGWDIINHTVTHPSLGLYSNEAGIDYQVAQARAWQIAQGDLVRGCEFYASPGSSSSRVSEKVIKLAGFKLQRHARKWNTSVTPWGIDNPHHVGACDWGSNTAMGVNSTTSGATSSIAGFQTATKIRRALDVVVAYGDTMNAFWHGLQSAGGADDVTGDDLLMTAAAFSSACAYARQLELAGSLTVCKGMSGFYYGNN